MQNNFVNMLNHITLYMKAALKKGDVLMRDLYFSKRHTDMEYVNIAAIMMQRNNAQYVMSIDNWKNIFQDKEIQKKLERPLTVLIPDVCKGTISYKAYRVFDIEQLNISQQVKNDFMSEHRSHLSLLIEEYTKQKIINLCGDKKYWRSELIKTYLEKFTFYEKAEKPIKKLYYRCLKSAFFEELEFTGKNELKVELEIQDFEARRIYKNIHELIAKFHFFFSDFVSNRAIREKERWEKLMLIRDSKAGIEDRIRRASEIKTGIRQRNQPETKKKDVSVEFYEDYEEIDNPPAYSEKDDYYNRMLYGDGGC